MKFYQLLFKTAADAHGACVGILGGGGKTTLMHTLGHELSAAHAPVVLSSLTKDGISPDHIVHFYNEFEDEETRQASLKQENPIYIMDQIENEHKLLGLNEEQLNTLNDSADLTIFECDGARKKPIKAHQPYDPEIPHFATHAIIIVGADAVGARVEGKHVHRPELFRELWDVKATYELDPKFIARVVTSQYGYLQKVPPDVKLAYLVNKADQYPAAALELAQAIIRVSNAPVFWGSLEQNTLEQVY